MDRAVRELEAARAAVPASTAVLYHLARALSERNEKERALSTIDEAIAKDPDNSTGRVFRAIILYDHGELSAAREGISGLEETNILASALGALLGLREKLRAPAADRGAPPLAISMPLGARWLSDVAGRLLALLDECLHARFPKEALEMHCSLFVPQRRAPEAQEGSGPGPAGKGALPGSRKEWLERIETAFLSRRLDEVEALSGREDLPEDWPDLQVVIYRALSLMGLGRDGRALSLLEDEIEKGGPTADGHFLLGLCHARASRLAEAGWCFVRAARAADIEIDQFIQDLLEKLGVQVMWTDLD